MDKNIFIIGAARSGKTTLARKLHEKYGYNIISLDDIINGLEVIPELGIHHDGDDIQVSKKFGKFLTRYLIELSEGPNFYHGIKNVIEGTHIDFEQVMPLLQEEKYKEKYEVIGLLYDEITEEELYHNIKEDDTEDDWTYWCDAEELRGNVRYFLERNYFFHQKFEQYHIKTYDVSHRREEVLETICSNCK